MRMMVLLLFVVAGSTAVASGADETQSSDRVQGIARFAKWEKAIQAFEQQDREKPVTTGQIVFVGSSSIRLWKLNESFAGLDVINRGFGGSEIADSTHFADRIVLKYRPRIVVMYAGDNDIAHGLSSEQVSADFGRFAALIRRELPETRLVYVAIKPSLARWKMIDQVRAANALIASACNRDEHLTFVDIDTPMIGRDGRPRPELFAKDGLHLSDEGYRVWTMALRPVLQSADSAR